MNLTKEQQEIYDGKQGATLAKVMQTLVRYGELFGADGMVPVTSKYNHLVTSFGLKALAPVYELMNQLIESGNVQTEIFRRSETTGSQCAKFFLTGFCVQEFHVLQAG